MYGVPDERLPSLASTHEEVLRGTRLFLATVSSAGSNPPIGTVGLTEEEARAKYTNVHIYRYGEEQVESGGTRAGVGNV